jgi:ribosomal protein L37E
MNHIFCSSCGNKIQYSLAKPNFCTKCGIGLSSISVAKNTAPSKARIQEEYDDLEEDETGVDFVPDIKRLAVDIESDGGNHSFTFGSLFGDSTKGYNGGRRKSIDDFIDEKKR